MLANGLIKLRRLQDPDQLLVHVCQAVVECCGFERVMLSRVDDSIWRPWKSFAVSERQMEREFRDWITAIPEIPLDHLLLESDMVRRRGAAIVTDGAGDPRVAPQLVAASGLTSYVAAPLMPGDRVVGFLHADYQDDEVTSLDRDILATFARAFDQLFERAVLLRRLKDQRDQMRAAMKSMDTVLDDLASAEIALDSSSHPSVTAPGEAVRLVPPAGGDPLEMHLTARELEVLALVATGATNDRIAERLLITNGTVKSHVKNILRKLRAENRAEAISKYLRLTIGRHQG